MWERWCKPSVGLDYRNLPRDPCSHFPHMLVDTEALSGLERCVLGLMDPRQPGTLNDCVEESQLPPYCPAAFVWARNELLLCWGPDVSGCSGAGARVPQHLFISFQPVMLPICSQVHCSSSASPFPVPPCPQPQRARALHSCASRRHTQAVPALLHPGW